MNTNFKKLLRDELLEKVNQLEAARIAYASEFDGKVGNIHENIRKLKTEFEKLQGEHYGTLHDQMQDTWGMHPGQSIGVSEINAFMESRYVHKPHRKLVTENKELKTLLEEADRMLSFLSSGCLKEWPEFQSRLAKVLKR